MASQAVDEEFGAECAQVSTSQVDLQAFERFTDFQIPEAPSLPSAESSSVPGPPTGSNESRSLGSNPLSLSSQPPTLSNDTLVISGEPDDGEPDDGEPEDANAETPPALSSSVTKTDEYSPGNATLATGSLCAFRVESEPPSQHTGLSIDAKGVLFIAPSAGDLLTQSSPAGEQNRIELLDDVFRSQPSPHERTDYRPAENPLDKFFPDPLRDPLRGLSRRSAGPTVPKADTPLTQFVTPAHEIDIDALENELRNSRRKHENPDTSKRLLDGMLPDDADMHTPLPTSPPTLMEHLDGSVSGPVGTEKNGSVSRSHHGMTPTKDKLEAISPRRQSPAKASCDRRSPNGSARPQVNLLDDEDEMAGSSGDTENAGQLRPGQIPAMTDFVESKYKRPVAEGAEDDILEDMEKLTVFVLHDGVSTPVSWHKDVAVADKREALGIACHAIANSGFLLKELIPLEADELHEMLERKEDRPGGKLLKVKQGTDCYYKRGRVFEFEDLDLLEPNKLYYLEQSNDRAELTTILGDRFRRYSIAIDPLVHIETQKAIRRMRAGSNLLKHTSFGYPHIRHFQLTPDLRRLLWYSGNKSKSQTTIRMGSITEIRVGKEVDGDKYGQFPLLGRFSFIIVADNLLELAAKDEDEFDSWVAGLKALAFWSRGKKINKLQLMSHSRRFIAAINPSASRDSVSNEEPLSLLNSLQLQMHSRSELIKREAKLRHRVQLIREQTRLIDIDSLRAAKTQAHDEQLTQCGSSEEQLAASSFSTLDGLDGPVISDEEMEFQKLIELIDSATATLAQAAELLATLDPLSPSKQTPTDLMTMSAGADEAPKVTKSEKEVILGDIGRILWRTEVDVENMEDIHARLVTEPVPVFQKRLSELNQLVSSDLQQLKRNFTHWINLGQQSLAPIFMMGGDPPQPPGAPRLPTTDSPNETSNPQ